jgi:small subunit ribosomal protein S19e
MDVDWYYTRAASIARKIYLNPGIGVGALARWYGDKTSSGAKPEHFRKASRGLIRHILQNLEKADLVSAVSESGGRRLSSEGQKEMDTIARLQMSE